MVEAISGGGFPWGTKGNLHRIGGKLRAGEPITPQDAFAVEIWRASHFNVMNAFNAMLRNRARRLPITIAQRHKRRITIIDKLHREPSMQLARMDDVAGIRLIFKDVPSLRTFRNNFLKAKHNHDKKNHDDKYDYIKMPKPSGYRGVHDVYAYKTVSEKHRFCSGTMIEVQYRTVHHHAWATANEVVTMITGQRTKFDQAENNSMEFFRLVSEMFARSFDRMTSVYKGISNHELIKKFEAVDKETWLTDRLRRLNVARERIKSGAVVLRFTRSQSLVVMPVPRFQEAMKFYFQAERDFPEDDVVLVNAPEAGDIRSAYRNYFSDTTEFLLYLDEAKLKLAGVPQVEQT